MDGHGTFDSGDGACRPAAHAAVSLNDADADVLEHFASDLTGAATSCITLLCCFNAI